DEAAALDTDAKLFAWAFAYPIWRSRNKDGAMFQQHELTRKAGVEISIYEINHHITGGDAPLEPRNRIVAGLGGGLNVANCMLLALKEHGARFQCLFSLAQHSYNAHNVGPVRLWGTALCMRKGHERYRPTFQACAAANEVLGGHLVATLHSGAEPTFAVTGKFRWRQPAETVEGLPSLWSYAFAEGARRGLILINLDTAKARPVAIQFAGEVAPGTARSTLLAANSIAASNEYEVGAPQVVPADAPLADFKSGTQLILPPFSLRVLKWEIANVAGDK
ncbi:hypothetical protein HQ576_16090, partial [bacterium]|nr:hypothetical protein [bacterium]